MDVVALKAEAYDCLVQIEIWKKKLEEVNAKIVEASKPAGQPKE